MTVLERATIHGGLVVATALALLSSAGGARAQTWYQSFDTAALDALAVPGRTRITVVAADWRSVALEGARLALVAALRASGKWTLVDADERRKLEPDIEDADVVVLERDARDVEAIWILRPLPSVGADAPASVAIGIYTSLGKSLHTLRVTEGVPLQVGARAPDPAAEYLAQRISPVVDRLIVTSPGPEVFTRAGGFAKDGARLRDARELYIAAGRHDLLRRYDATSDARFLATIISGGAIFIGAVLFMQDVFSDGGTPSTEIGGLGLGGIVTAGVGTIGLVIARLVDPDPLDWRGKVEMATTYNARLRTRLGAPAAGASESSTTGARVTLAVSPLGDGLALTLSGAF